jgi:general secretion pathway protein B
MSYILEALKKSELERRQGTAPGLKSAPLYEVETEARGSRVLYMSAGALALAVIAFLVGWLRPWQPEPSGEPQRVAAAPADRPAPDSGLHSRMSAGQGGETEGRRGADNAANDAIATHHAATVWEERGTPGETGQLAAPEARAKATDAQILQPEASEGSASRQPASAAMGPREWPKLEARHAKPSAARAAGNPARAAGETPATTVAASPAASALRLPPARVVAFAELPDAIQRGLPKITITGFGGSGEPGSRMAVINDRVVREGEEVSAGLKLERIGPESVILNYQGYRFHPER